MNPSRETWPDPGRPGYPPQPDKDGVHALLPMQGGPPEIAKWSAEGAEWLLPGASLPKSAGWAGAACGYLSPLFTGDDMRAAFEKGMTAGYETALSQIEDAERRVADALQDRHRAELREARRQGAVEMRRLASDAVEASDASLMASQLRTFEGAGNGGAAWYRRLRLEAIRALPLPGDAPGGMLAKIGG